METGAGRRTKHVDILFRLLLFPSGSWKRDHHQGEEEPRGWRLEEKGESKNNHPGGWECPALGESRSRSVQHRVLEDMKLSNTRQPGYVLFPATFSCLGIGCRTYDGGVLSDDYDGKEGPGSWYIQSADYHDRSWNQCWVRRERGCDGGRSCWKEGEINGWETGPAYPQEAQWQRSTIFLGAHKIF